MTAAMLGSFRVKSELQGEEALATCSGTRLYGPEMRVHIVRMHIYCPECTPPAGVGESTVLYFC